MLSIVGPEQRVPKDHPIRRIKALADAALVRLSPVFEAMYSGNGRPSIPPETLLKSCLLIALFSIRSERQFCEQLDYNLLFRFFLDMSLEEKSFDASTFAKNKERLLKADVARLFFEEVVAEARRAHLLSEDHFTVDGTLIQAWASLKSFKPKGDKDRRDPPPSDPGNPSVNWRGERRSNETHESTTDPEARLATKGGHQEAKMSFSAHALMENRNGLCVDLSVSTADGFAERREALAMSQPAKAKARRRNLRLVQDGGQLAEDTISRCRAKPALGLRPGRSVRPRSNRRPAPAAGRVARSPTGETTRLPRGRPTKTKATSPGRSRSAKWRTSSARGSSSLLH